MNYLEDLSSEELLERGNDPRYGLSGDGARPLAPERQMLNRLTAKGLSRVDSQHARGRLSDAAATKLESLIRKDRSGETARYCEVAASDAYEGAFAKILSDPRYAHLMLTDRERDMVALAASIDIGGPPSGVGYIVPLTIDPTVNVANDGAINPFREIARTETITGNTWQGINSEGVTAEYAPELTEVGDGTPDFAAPNVRLKKAQSYVEASLEVLDDWPQASQQLAKLLADAKDRLEAEKFLTGTGTNEPLGLLTSLDAVGDPVVISSALTDDMVYTVRGDLGSRYQPRARWLAHPTTFDAISRLAGPGSDQPALMTSDPLTVLRRPGHEASSMAPTVLGSGFGGDDLIVYGDFSQFVVVDKLGLRLEIVQTVLGANRRPKGARGFYAYWRSGCGVISSSAFRALQQPS